MPLLIGIAVGVILLVGLVYWFNRPVTWQDGEGNDVIESPLIDSDVGSWRWSWMRGSEEGRALGFFLYLRDTWENERRRWRK